MRIYNTYGSKERLFEMMNRVGGVQLNEQALPTEKRKVIIDEFIEYAVNKIDLGDNQPNVEIINDEGIASENKSFGSFTPYTSEIKIVATNRNLADVLRTLAHELVHFKQHCEGRLNAKSGEDGSEHENEANSLAGILLREFGKNNPIIFE